MTTTAAGGLCYLLPNTYSSYIYICKYIHFSYFSRRFWYILHLWRCDLTYSQAFYWQTSSLNFDFILLNLFQSTLLCLCMYAWVCVGVMSTHMRLRVCNSLALCLFFFLLCSCCVVSCCCFYFINLSGNGVWVNGLWWLELVSRKVS